MSAGELNINTSANLVALYHFNGNLNDSSANNYTCTNVATTTDDYGRFGRGRFFSSGYLTNTIPNFGNTAEFTIMAWVNGSSFAANPTVIARNDGSTRNFTLTVNTNGTIFFSNRSSGADVNSVGAITINKWHHLCVTRSTAASGTNKIYINGKLDITQTNCGDNGLPTTTTCIGSSAFSPPSAVWSGYLDEIALFGRVWSDTEVKNYYAWALGVRTSTP